MLSALSLPLRQFIFGQEFFFRHRRRKTARSSLLKYFAGYILFTVFAWYTHYYTFLLPALLHKRFSFREAKSSEVLPVKRSADRIIVFATLKYSPYTSFAWRPWRQGRLSRQA